MNLRERIKQDVVLFDGAMGTMIQRHGMKLGELPEVLNLTRPGLVQDIHQSYAAAGSHVLTTNTFGANALKLHSSGYSVDEVVRAAVRNARAALGGQCRYVVLDIGPLGELIEPVGTLTFDEAYDLFKTQVIAGSEEGVDAILIETVTDLAEARAAVLAARENSDLPVFCTMSFEANGRTFTGCSPEAMIMTLEGLGVDAIGTNCSLGPKDLEPIVDTLLAYATRPVMVQANAGLPVMKDGQAHYTLDAENYAAYAERFTEKGVTIIGGCCGTTDEYIAEIAVRIGRKRPGLRIPGRLSGLCTDTTVVNTDSSLIVGERINPTGKAALAKALINRDYSHILKEAIDQLEAGADLLDVNVGLPAIDDAEAMREAIKGIQSVVDVPLLIDSTDERAIEAGLRVYCGKGLVNSVNGEDDVLDRILPIVSKYGAAVVGLTLDEAGIPKTAEQRLAIAEKILNRAIEFGIDPHDVYIDCLVLPAAADETGAGLALEAMKLVQKKLGAKTIFGVSNVSFGLPNRPLINRVFLAACLQQGLNLAIVDPLDQEMVQTVRASNALWRGEAYTDAYIQSQVEEAGTPSADLAAQEAADSLSQAILRGDEGEVRRLTKHLLLSRKPLEVIDDELVPALDIAGARYETGEMFLPGLIRTAETACAAFEIVQEEIVRYSSERLSRGKIVLATVRGDIHDIGKNLVKVLLESYQFEVIDLGKDVPADTIVETVTEQDVSLVGLSSLMTTTVQSMEDTIAQIKSARPGAKIMVGGAVLESEDAARIGADFYGSDAREAVRIAQEWFRQTD